MASGGSSSSPSPAMVSWYVPENRVLYRTLSSSSSPAPAAEKKKKKKVMPAATVPSARAAACRCCPQQSASGNDSSSAGCVEMKCCYGINCNLPGKPFGTCAFTPHTCGCNTNDDCPAKPPPAP